MIGSDIGLVIIRALVLWIALWLTTPLMWWCYMIATKNASGELGWLRFAFVSFWWALFFLLGAIG